MNERWTCAACGTALTPCFGRGEEQFGVEPCACGAPLRQSLADARRRIDVHHTLGGSVLRLSPLKKASPPRTLIDRVRDFFLLW